MAAAAAHKQSDGRAHPLLGLRPGNHTRLLKVQRAEPFVPGRPARVLREARSSAWTVVEAADVLPEIDERFGRKAGTVTFTINGAVHSLKDGDVPVRTSLAEYLRFHVGLTGTKIGCGEGGCGACTVVLKEGGRTRVANSCLRPVLSLDGIDVLTTEGLGSSAKGFHEVQSTVAKCDGTQCGMCTPGMVMAIYGYLDKTAGKDVNPEEAESCIQGNLCRCTGYRPIYKAIHELCDSRKARVEHQAMEEETEAFEVPTRRFRAADGESLWLNCAEPSDIFAALKAYGARPHRLVVGGTSAGVVKYYPKHPSDSPTVFINIAGVEALRSISKSASSVTLGSAVTLSEVVDALASVPGFEAVVAHLKLVAHPQVRDVASWAGNVMMAKTHKDFPSDVCLLLTLLQATLTISDGSNSSTVQVEDFLHGDPLPSGFILMQMQIPIPGDGDVVDSFKIMRRHMNTHAEVNAGFHFTFADSANGPTVKSARLVFGNISLGPLLAEQTASVLVGAELTVDAATPALAALEEELVVEAPSVEDPPFVVADADYRKSLAKSLLYKAWLGVIVKKLGAGAVDKDLVSASTRYERPASSGEQKYSMDEADAPVGQAIEKLEGPTQASGEVKFTGDITWPRGTCVGYMILAKQVGRIASIDATAALAAPGIVGFVAADTVANIGANNAIQGTAYEIFAAAQTKHVGQFVGMICAETMVQAQAAAGLVEVRYQGGAMSATPPTLAQAMALGKVQGDAAPIMVPATEHFAEAQSVTGKMVTTGQKHFYMETQVAFAIPDGGGAMRVSVATQSMDMMKNALASGLNIRATQVTVENIRSGGCYGGKHTLSLPCALAAAVAAKSLQRPVLLQLDRNADFLALGARQPNVAEWTTEYASSGKITGFTQTVTTDCGYDKSGNSYGTGLNCYDITGAKLSNSSAITATPINTIMRAPGEFQAALFIEAAVEQVARAAKLDPTVVQEANMNSEMTQVWKACKEQASYDALRADCNSFNAANRYRKRGVYMMGSLYTYGAYWQEKALVTVEADGTVSLDHTGLENGQGIHTKVAQAAAHEFLAIDPNFDMSNIDTVVPHSTAHYSWSSITPTYGSGTSETVTGCVSGACQTIASRLDKYKSKGSWKDIVAAAAADGVSLSATEQRLPSMESGYKITVASCISAEIDVLTGETHLLTCDVVQDAGKALNPAIDVGQVEGCIVQALGFCLTEELSRSHKDGRLINCGTWDYKIPSGLDIPIKMNVTFLPSDNKARGNVFGSKMTGEPAYLVGGAAFYAVKDAIYAARADADESNWFEMDLPASVDRVQQACLVGL